MVLTILWIWIAKCCFLVILKYKNSNFEQNLKSLKTKKAGAYDVIYLTIVAMETK